MKIHDLIAASQTGQAVRDLARAANVPPEQLDRAVNAILPALAEGIERNTLSRGGLADLVAALGDGHHEAILDNPSALADPRVAQDGNAILGHILGSKERSRAVAMQAAQASGLSEGIIRMLLPYIAQLVMGAIAKWAKGGLGDVIGKLPGGSGAPIPAPGQRRSGGGGYGGGFELPRSDMPQGNYPMPPMPGGEGGPVGRGGSLPTDEDAGGGFQIPWPGGGRGQGQGGGLPFPFPFPFPLPGGGGPDRGDQEQDQPQDAPPRSGRRGATGGYGGGGGFELPQSDRPEGGYPLPPISGGPPVDEPQPRRGGGPLSMPQADPPARNPYGDLSDILRRGGGTTADGSPLGSVVRNAIGSLFGFGGRGVIGWFVRFLVLRFGWGLLRRILGRVLPGGR